MIHSEEDNGFDRTEFINWLEAVRKLMIRTKILKSDVVLDESTWRVYYNEGLNPYDTLVEEFGHKFRRRFRRSHIERITKTKKLQQ